MAGQSCCRRRRRADRAPHRAQGRVAGRPRARSRGRGARGRGHDLVRHRRGRDRQGARHVRGHHDARALPRRRARRGRQADDARAHRGLGRRLDRDRRGQARRGRHPRAGADRRLREAVRVQRDVGLVGRDAVPGTARRRCGRLLRAADPRVHVPLGRAAAHRPPRRGEGPPRRAAQPEGAPAHPRHRPADGRGVVPAVGPAAVPRRVPVLGRRDGDGARQREGRGSRARTRVGVDPRHGDAQRADDVRPPGPGEPASRPRLREGPLRAGRHHQPARGLRLRRDLRAVLVVRADVAGEPRVLRGRRGLEADRGRRDRARRRHPVEPVGRRALVEPDRRVGHDPVR